MRQWFRALLVVIVAVECSLLVEGGLHFLNTWGVIHIGRPTYSFHNLTSQFWSDIDPSFGVWHHAGASIRHAKSCFDLTYRANSHGARDKERSLRSASDRIVFLGDSFVEGWGVEAADRFTNRLEDATGIPHLNFGTSGSFGTVQSALLYANLANRFDHQSILALVLPANDFQDNDQEFGLRYRSGRYRPYLVGHYPSYELVYHDIRNLGSKTGRLEKVAREFTHSFHAKEFVDNVLRARRWERTGYDRFSEEQFDLMRFSLERLVAESGGRDVYVVTIPILADLERYERSGRSPLGERLAALAERAGFWYGDMLPYMRERSADWSAYYLSCDGHWSPHGHAVAAEFLRDRLPVYQRAEGI